MGRGSEGGNGNLGLPLGISGSLLTPVHAALIHKKLYLSNRKITPKEWGTEGDTGRWVLDYEFYNTIWYILNSSWLICNIIIRYSQEFKLGWPSFRTYVSMLTLLITGQVNCRFARSYLFFFLYSVLVSFDVDLAVVGADPGEEEAGGLVPSTFSAGWGHTAKYSPTFGGRKIVKMFLYSLQQPLLGTKRAFHLNEGIFFQKILKF